MAKTKEQISYNMKQVMNKDFGIEWLLRKELWVRDLRYRKNVKTIFGHLEIAFIGRKFAACCDSEFWHGYDWAHKSEVIKSNREFWIPKIERNIERDKEVNTHLEEQGWTVIRFWVKRLKIIQNLARI